MCVFDEIPLGLESSTHVSHLEVFDSVYDLWADICSHDLHRHCLGFTIEHDVDCRIAARTCLGMLKQASRRSCSLAGDAVQSK